MKEIICAINRRVLFVGISGSGLFIITYIALT